MKTAVEEELGYAIRHLPGLPKKTLLKMAKSVGLVGFTGANTVESIVEALQGTPRDTRQGSRNTLLAIRQTQW